ncbi:sulfurtransferase [Romboutsia sp. 1001713B170207_170306_H8]|uniref:sulfurtransferase n=1 Tax=Romboutsia sp. 1001713B170207_170306_H8 TaxID=2787112 RepID=UPI000821F65B|nr:sulfurtransferase [Romboutsia sp. 1001713B170207_170306_H8]SCH42890.1 3-mercaptopyruvate sulfurtransferase [uncultured Clostridium sp.]
MSNLVNASWLKEHLNDKNIVIVDCRFNLMDKEYGKRSYEKGHIKGARRIDIETELSSEVKVHGGRHPLPSIDKLKNTFENVGIRNDSIVVCYDEGDLSGPARLWWILKYLGHKNVYVLDGGIKEFEEIGGEITREVGDVNKGNIDINIQENMRVDMIYVRNRIDNKNVAIVDSREYKRYIGEFEPVDKKCGHIPNAKSYFWMNILNEKSGKFNLKSKEELNKLFEELKGYKEVIVYCGSGITACPNSLALSEIGINHKVYTGSFSDWISYDDNKVDIK